MTTEPKQLVCVEPAIEGDLLFCVCGSMPPEGHTFHCIMEQKKRRDAAFQVSRELLNAVTKGYASEG